MYKAGPCSRTARLLQAAPLQPEKTAEGLTALAEAQSLVEENEERYREAELQRLRGELLLMEDAPASEVEPCFHQCIEVARRQQAKSLELRGEQCGRNKVRDQRGATCSQRHTAGPPKGLTLLI
ncbi:MAG TPA: hypothetical protein VKK81_22830 [Candidatus Binatia bacterium]|nr:hypothetical protein [Candidatus Binatia bacterium]